MGPQPELFWKRRLQMTVEERIDREGFDHVVALHFYVHSAHTRVIIALLRRFSSEALKIKGYRKEFLHDYFSYFCIFRAKESGQKNKKLKNQNDIIFLGENYESTLAGVKNPCYLFVYSNIVVQSFLRGGRGSAPDILNY